MRMFKKNAINFPLFYGIVYILLIPTFAFIFYSLPKEINFNGSLNSLISYLYFSAVTITTLGYGDISAKSEMAQLIVIFETLSGVITIGLFLNSLSVKKSLQMANDTKIEEDREKRIHEYERLMRHNKIINTNINLYKTYTMEIITPSSMKLNGQYNQLDTSFLFNDLKNLYHPSFRMGDSLKESAIIGYYKHQNNLVQSIHELILNVNFTYWQEFENECIEFIKNNKDYDCSSIILSNIDKNLRNLGNSEDKKLTDFIEEMIENYKGNLITDSGNIINPFIILFYLININLKFIKDYENNIKKITEDIHRKFKNI